MEHGRVLENGYEGHTVFEDIYEVNKPDTFYAILEAIHNKARSAEIRLEKLMLLSIILLCYNIHLENARSGVGRAHLYFLNGNKAYYSRARQTGCLIVLFAVDTSSSKVTE